MLSNILDRISFWSLFVVIVLLPVFFLPFTQIPIETSKGLLFVMCLAISIIFKNIKNAKTVFWEIIISSAVLFLFRRLRLFMPDLLSFGILGGKSDNIL